MEDGTSVPQGFVVDLDGFEGPLDLLLALARAQKIDLARLSVLALAEQYLAFLARARELKLEIAADYLVMAAWLLYLKSRLLLPEVPGEEPDPEELAAELARRLAELDRLRRAGDALLERPRLGIGRHARGLPEGIRVRHDDRFALSLFELLDAYRGVRRAQRPAVLVLRPPRVDTLDQALRRLTRLLGGPEWRSLLAFLPDDAGDPLYRRSAVASSFAASLELVRTGEAELRQASPFGPILIRRRA